MRNWMTSRLARFGAPAVLIGTLAACGGETAEAGVLPEGPPEGEVVALGYDAGADRLLKAHPHALYESADDGASWTPIALPSMVQTGQISAVAAADSGRVLYVAGPGVGVMQSTDAGKTWVSRGETLPGADVAAFAVHADQPNTLYAALTDGIYRSEDAGQTWKKTDDGPGEPIRQFFHSDMPGSMQTGWLFAVTSQGVRRSMDCFCGWRPTGELPGGAIDVAYDPSEPKRVYVSTASGLFRSEDSGESWEKAAAEPISSLVADASGTLYGVTPEGELMRSADQGRSWERGGA
jgi:photosystem II stability/assembly factor-like uncharacterized protein